MFQKNKITPGTVFDQPFGIGIIELPEGIKVLSMLTTSDPNALKIGMNMELLIEKMYEDEDGNERLTWKFRPIHD